MPCSGFFFLVEILRAPALTLDCIRLQSDPNSKFDSSSEIAIFAR